MAKALYGKYNSAPVYGKVRCSSYGCEWGRIYEKCTHTGNGTINGVCRLCNSQLGVTDRDGYVWEKCSTCKGTGYVDAIVSYAKGSYIQDLKADLGSLPNDGKHTDGYWYVFIKKLIDIKTNISGVWKDASDLFVNINGVWKNGENKENINGVWR